MGILVFPSLVAAWGNPRLDEKKKKKPAPLILPGTDLNKPIQGQKQLYYPSEYRKHPLFRLMTLLLAPSLSKSLKKVSIPNTANPEITVRTIARPASYGVKVSSTVM